MAEILEPHEKPDNGSGSASEASNGFEVVEDPNEEAVVDSTSNCETEYCLKTWLESIRHNKELMDLLKWRNPIRTGIVFSVGLLLILSLGCMSFISVIGYSGLAAILASLSWKGYRYVSKSTCDKSFFECQFQLHREDVDACVQRLIPHVNAALSFLNRLLRLEDPILVLKTVVSLLLLDWFGSYFDLLTIVAIDFVLAFILPPIYDRQHEQIDATLNKVKEKFDEVKDLAKSKLAKKQS